MYFIFGSWDMISCWDASSPLLLITTRHCLNSVVLEMVGAFMMVDFLFILLGSCKASRKECASYMVGLPVPFRYEYLMAETIFSQVSQHLILNFMLLLCCCSSCGIDSIKIYWNKFICDFTFVPRLLQKDNKNATLKIWVAYMWYGMDMGEVWRYLLLLVSSIVTFAHCEGFHLTRFEF